MTRPAETRDIAPAIALAAGLSLFGFNRESSEKYSPVPGTFLNKVGANKRELM